MSKETFGYSLSTTQTKISDIVKIAYGWTVDENGYLAGLVAGDMGYEETDTKLIDFVLEAFDKTETHKVSNELNHLLEQLIRKCVKIIYPKES